MAVSAPGNPNLAPSYENVMQELNQRANLNVNAPQIAGAAADAINTNTNRSFEMGKILMQHKLNTDLEKMKQEFESRGDVLVTPEIKDKFKQEFGMDLPLPDNSHLTAEDLKRIQDTITEGTQKLHSKNMQDLLKNPQPQDPKWTGKLASEWVGAGKSGDAKELIDMVAGAGVITKVNPADGLMHKYNKYTGSDLGPDTGPGSSAAPGGLNPAEIKSFNPIAKEYNAKTITEKEKLTNITKANELIDNPEAKGIGQNVALMSTVRDSISSASRMNQIELQNVTGLPDAINRGERVYAKLVNGEALTSDDKIALHAVLSASAKETGSNIQSIEDQYTNSAAAAMPQRDPAFVRAKLTGRPMPQSVIPPSPPQAPPGLPAIQPGAAPGGVTPSGQAPLASAATGPIASPQEEANAYLSKFRAKPK